MPIRAIARLIQTMLYAHRFFPYYVFNILGGVEDDGASFRSKVAHILSSIYKVLVQYILLILLGRTKGKRAELLAPHKLLCSRS